MTDLDIHDPLHGVVHEALIADATRAPRLAAKWRGGNLVSISTTGTRHLRRLVVIGAAAALVLVAMLAGAARPGNDDTGPSTAAASWTPDGTEFPLTDLGPATVVDHGGPVVAALTRQVGVEGHPPQIIATFLDYRGNDTALEERCTSEKGSAGCRPAGRTPSWSTAVTSSVDNGFADYDLWTIEGLPADIAFVSYVDGDQRLWQRPIMGFAAFPNVTGSNEVLIAYDTSGTEVGRYDGERETAIALSSPYRLPPKADLSKQDFGYLLGLTHDEMVKCLTGHGATLNVGEVATFPDDVDQIAVWTQCVITVQQVVADAVKTLNPRFYDPVTERPENPDSAYTNAAIDPLEK